MPVAEIRKLETLVLSYNRIPADQINRLAGLPRLLKLDLSYNDLYTLPENMSGFAGFKTLALAGNSFSTDSVLFSSAEKVNFPIEVVGMKFPFPRGGLP